MGEREHVLMDRAGRQRFEITGCSMARSSAGKGDECMKTIGRFLIVGALLLTGISAAKAQNRHLRDNGDGTVSDLDNHLMWEKKTGTPDDEGPFCRPNDKRCRDPHSVNNRYQWSDRDDPREVRDGTAFTDFLGELNRDVSQNGVRVTGCFANHCDWRLPTSEELLSLVDSRRFPRIDAIFGPTQGNLYWSDTTWEQNSRRAWGLNFQTLDFDPFDKTGYLFVRAVRSER
jgi:Protein of unknown function (DUF1566)